MANFIPNENSFVGFSAGPIGLMGAPTGVSATAVSGGGTLPAATYDYVITGVNETGETQGSTVATATLTAEGGVSLAWASLAGASSYRVYGRTSPEKLLTEVTGTSWQDSGTLTPGTNTPPVASSASNIAAPNAADITQAIDLTRFITGLNFSSTGNTVPVPNLSSLFEGTISGTSTAQATMDCYRDDVIDTAWTLLPRGTKGYVIISRYGGMPVHGSVCEVWPVRVTSRAMANMTSNTVETFTVTYSVPEEPAEAAIVN